MSLNVCQWSQVPASAAQSFAMTMPAFAPGVATPSDSFVWALQNQTAPGHLRHPFLLPPGGERYYSGLLARVPSGALVLGVAAYLGGGHEAIAGAIGQKFRSADRFLWGGELFCRADSAGQGVAARVNETSGYLRRWCDKIIPYEVDHIRYFTDTFDRYRDDAERKNGLLRYPDSYERLLRLRMEVLRINPELAIKLNGLIPLEALRALEGEALHSALLAMKETADFLKGQLSAPADALKWVSPNGIAEIQNTLERADLVLPFPVSPGTGYVPFSPDNQHLDTRLNSLLKRGDNARHMAGNQIGHVRLALAAGATSEQKRGELLGASGPYNLLYTLRRMLERDDPDVLGMLDGLISTDKLRASEGEELRRAIESLDLSLDFVVERLSAVNPAGTYHLFELSRDTE